MKIGDLATRTGVSARSLRYYEAQGLIRPSRDLSGHRQFEDHDVDRVLAIQELFSAGFCSTVIQELLPTVVDPRDTDAGLLAAHFEAARRRLRRELRLVERELDQLARVQARLGLAPDTHVKDQTSMHDDEDTSPPAPADHRDRRLR
jgi:DNA-binding transcriptional MerR regulator